MLGGINGTSGIAPVVSALSSASSSAASMSQQLRGISSHAASTLYLAPEDEMKAALRMPVQQMSLPATIGYLTAALAGAVAASGLQADPFLLFGHESGAVDDSRSMGYTMAALGLPTGVDGPRGMTGVLPLHDPPNSYAVPSLHVSHTAGLASLGVTQSKGANSSHGLGGKALRPRSKTSRKRGEIPNPGVNGSLGGATPAAIQAEGGFQCPLCDRVYKSESGLRLHRRTVHEGFKGYPCPHCNKLFTQKSHVKTHVRAVHEGKRDYNCPVCTKLFTRASNRDRHVRTVHRNASIHPCDMCERVFISEEDLLEHKEAHHTSSTALAIALLCPQCHAPFQSRALLNQHLYTIHAADSGGYPDDEDVDGDMATDTEMAADSGRFAGGADAYLTGGAGGMHGSGAPPQSAYALPSTKAPRATGLGE